MKRKILVSVLVVFLVFTYACKNKKETAKETKQTSCENVKWDYKNGDNGAENWGNLCTGFVDCNGKEQSPIDIVTSEVVQAKSPTILDFSYSEIPVAVVNNGHSIKFNVSGTNSLTIGEDTFKLLQFHYHTVSKLDYYHYDGSLTTPPCSEIVEWYVLKIPLTASKEQLNQMLAIMHENNRPIQALNGRKIISN